VRVLFVGDVVGRPGRELLKRGLAALARARQADVVVANGENASAGAGLTRESANDLFGAGVHVITGGNHIWDRRELLQFIDREPRIVRPANYPAGTPGRGSTLVQTGSGTPVGVVNVMGRVFLATIDDPFAAAEREIAALVEAGARVIVVDMHAETTSEKIALSWVLDGRVTAVIGTHTHVQTADERILPGGTACLTDAGMTGPHDGVIGMDRDAVIARFRTGLPARFEPASGDLRLNGVLITADAETGTATAIERISLSAQDLERIAAAEAAVVS
jgi:metallophosphoesterase (TIGR00282 family)